jgi:hypothetical protein
MTFPRLSDISWLHTNVSGWTQTSTITAIVFFKDAVEVKHTMAGKWPTFKNEKGKLIEGNPWVIGFFEGKWYAATYEWLEKGQTKKYVTADDIGEHTKKEPLRYKWNPQPGEVVGFMISGTARDNNRTAQERSDIVFVKWGSNEIIAREGEPVSAPPPSPPPTPPAPTEPPLFTPPPAAPSTDHDLLLRALDTIYSVDEKLVDVMTKLDALDQKADQMLAQAKTLSEQAQQLMQQAGTLNNLAGLLNRK